ncbi:CD209 antigen-like protein E isoform X2 [Melanotaenia boesemani]|uniref:CD209 antigen-like protein E isoform X2 n=1 Tax=Melanotaenia boesemani TaxID=1250792 RepID=UPI001C05C774|nr:CD209 antigen-like protein E isoform X2 [Melanotaenia boesemani]
MSSHIYAKPDLSKKVRYTRKEREGGEEWEEKVNIYETAGDVVDNRTNFQAQDGAPQTPKHPTVQRGLVGGAVLCLVMLAGIMTLSIYISLKIGELSNSNSQLKAKLAESCCSDGWIRFGHSCYFISTERKTWTESRNYCQERGADLVIINSKEEQEFLSKLSSWFWIGLEWTGRGWKWLDGSPLTETFWKVGGQNRYGSYTVCYNYQGKWETAYSSYISCWICEKKTSVSQ